MASVAVSKDSLESVRKWFDFRIYSLTCCQFLVVIVTEIFLGLWHSYYIRRPTENQPVCTTQCKMGGAQGWSEK
jgi:hypothetical protein